MYFFSFDCFRLDFFLSISKTVSVALYRLSFTKKEDSVVLIVWFPITCIQMQVLYPTINMQTSCVGLKLHPSPTFFLQYSEIKIRCNNLDKIHQRWHYEPLYFFLIFIYSFYCFHVIYLFHNCKHGVFLQCENSFGCVELSQRSFFMSRIVSIFPS